MIRNSWSLQAVAACLFLGILGPSDAATAPATDGDCQSRECRYFRHRFELANGPGHEAAFAAAYEAIRSEWEKLHAVSPGVSLGAMLALVVFESGARLDFFNTKDAENSFQLRLDPARPFVDQPLAYYSYQLGIVPIHTSLLRPCMKGTQALRKRFDEVTRQEGFEPKPEEIELVRSRWKVACAESHRDHVEQAGPQAVDYYILQTHAAPFNVPANGKPPHETVKPESLKAFPFFSPRVTAPLFFATLARSAKGIQGDADAIKAFGGGDAAYMQPERQAAILGSWQKFR